MTGALTTILLKVVVLWYIVILITSKRDFHSSSFAHPNEDGTDLPLQSLKTMKVLPYYQMFDWKNNPIKYDSEMQKVIGFEIISNQYYSNQIEPKRLVGIRDCTREDFVGIEHVYDAKNEGAGKDTLICPDNIE